MANPFVRRDSELRMASGRHKGRGGKGGLGRRLLAVGMAVLVLALALNVLVQARVLRYGVAVVTFQQRTMDVASWDLPCL